MKQVVLIVMVIFFSGKIYGESGNERSGNDAVLKLVEDNPGVTDSAVLAYIKKCEKAAARYPALPADSKKVLYKKIGDTYYELGELRFPGRWNAWYRKAVAIDQELVKNTPIGFRLQEYEKYAKRRNVLITVFTTYGIVLLLFAVRIFRNFRAFDGHFLVKRISLLALVFAACSALIFSVDARLFKKTGSTFIRDDAPCGCSADDQTKALIKPFQVIVRPTIPFSIINRTEDKIFWIIMLLGFLPVVLGALYQAFGERYSRIMLGFIVYITVTAFWSHFFVVTAFGHYWESGILMTKARAIYRGELEDMILKDPHKVFRANPGVMKTSNVDFQLFMKEHYPQGIPAK